jgi:flagellar hook-associated protein 3 FlgL
MSVYRVATANTFDRARFNIQQRQSELGVSQEQLSSGKRVRKASDDAVAATLSERTLNRQARTEADTRALEASRRSLAQAESALGDVSELYARFQELLTQAGDGALNNSDRDSIANEMEGIRERILSLSNLKDTAGKPLFAGLGPQNVNGNPFVENVFAPVATTYGPDGRAVQWAGTDGQYAATETLLPQMIDGSPAFGDSTSNIWETFDRAIGALRNNSGTALTTELDTARGELASRQDALLTARGKLGDWLNRADNLENVFGDRKVAYEKENSELVDVDMVDAISKFQMNQTAYQAALQSYSQVQKMSMFDYLR